MLIGNLISTDILAQFFFLGKENLVKGTKNMNRLNYLILQTLKVENAIDKVSAMAIRELPLQDFACSVSMIQKEVRKMVLKGYLQEGFKDGNCKTYYISETGIKALE